MYFHWIAFIYFWQPNLFIKRQIKKFLTQRISLNLFYTIGNVYTTKWIKKMSMSPLDNKVIHLSNPTVNTCFRPNQDIFLKTINLVMLTLEIYVVFYCWFFQWCNTGGLKCKTLMTKSICTGIFNQENLLNQMMNVEFHFGFYIYIYWSVFDSIFKRISG